MAFSGITFRGGQVSNTNGTTVSVSPSANVVVGKVLFAFGGSDNNDTTDSQTSFHTISDSVGNTWTKLCEYTETDGAANDGSTASIWYTIVTTQIGTGNSVTLTLGASKTDKCIGLLEVTKASDTIISVRSHAGLRNDQNVTWDLVGLGENLVLNWAVAEGEDNAKTAPSTFNEHWDGLTSTSGALDANISFLLSSALKTDSTGGASSSAWTYTNLINITAIVYETRALSIPIVSESFKVNPEGVYKFGTDYTFTNAINEVFCDRPVRMTDSRVCVVDGYDGKIRMLELATNGTWSLVGNITTMSITGLVSIARLSDTEIAVWFYGSNDVLRKYSFNGTDWSLVGNSFTTSDLEYPTICALSSSRVVVYRRASNTIDGELLAYDFDGTNWAQVGSTFTITGEAVNNLYHSSVFALSSTDIVVALSSSNFLARYTFNGSAFSLVGNSTAPGFTSDQISVADYDKANNKVVILRPDNSLITKFSHNGTNWANDGNLSGLDNSTIIGLDKLRTDVYVALKSVVSNPAATLQLYGLYPQALLYIGVTSNILIATSQNYLVTGNNANLLQGYRLTCDVASFALTGNTANLFKGRKFIADTQSYVVTGNATLFKRSMIATVRTYVLTGNAANLLQGYRLTCDVASFALTGNTANLIQGYKLIADVQSYAVTGNATLFKRSMIALVQSYVLTGNAANLIKGRKILADVQSYVLTGNNANLLQGYRLTCDVASFALTGNATNLLQGYKLTANVQSYVLTGSDVTLTITNAEVLIADVQSYILTGNNANLLQGYKLLADLQTYLFTGNNVNLVRHYRLTCDVQSYIITGNIANLVQGYRLTADVQSYVITGNQSLFNRKMIAISQQYVFTGNAANLLKGKMLIADQGSYVVTGIDTTLVRHYRLTCDTQSYTTQGFDVNIKINRILRADVQSYNVTGFDVNFTRIYILRADTQTYVVTGFAVTFPYSQNLGAAHGVFVFTGNNATLVYSPVGSYTLNAERGIFTLIPSTTNLLRGYRLSCESGSFNLVGNDTNLRRGFRLTSDPGSYVLSGIEVQFLIGIRLLVETGSFSLGAQNVQFTRDYVLLAGQGIYILTGNDVTLTSQNSYILTCDSGTFDINESETFLRRGLVFIVESGIFEVTSYAIELPRGYLVTTETGMFVVTGNSAVLGSIGMRVRSGGQFVPGRMYVWNGNSWVGSAHIYRNGQWKAI